MGQKLFLRNGAGKVIRNSSGGAVWRLNACSVEEGGDIRLANGDILHINERNGGLDPWDNGYDEYNGIGLSLESGDEFIAFLVNPSLENNTRVGLETGYGYFYDIS